MAAVPAQDHPSRSPVMTSPPLKGLKKVLSTRRRSSEVPQDSSFDGLRTNSVDSINLDKSPTRQSINSSPSRQGSSKSGSSGVRKFIPGHTKRKRRRVREEELRTAAEDVARGRETLPVSSPPAALSRRHSSLTQDGDSSLLTDDSELETPPPLISRESHAAFLTTSSPLISTTTVREDDQEPTIQNPSTEQVPSILEPEIPEPSPSPKSPPYSESTNSLPLPGLVDKADSLRPDSRRSSISKLRGKSPVRRFKDVFSKPGKSPRTSPERSKVDTPVTATDALPGESVSTQLDTSLASEVTTARTSSQSPAAASPLPVLDTNPRPMTPPTGITETPVTTVTPPTPTDVRFDDADASPKPDKINSAQKDGSGVVVSPSGNMISHRRIRSQPSTREPSKLSNSITAPLSPTIEEIRTPSGGTTQANRTVSGSFFSSWVSAAQNAATTITNLTNQNNRSRSGTTTSDSAQAKIVNDVIEEEQEESSPETPRKQLAVETLGSGDLNFEHLGLNGEEKSRPNMMLDLAELRKNSTVQRDEAAAKEEDILAKRAVSQAYERPIEATPVAEIPDPISQLRNSQPFGGNAAGDQSPPNGSILDGESGSVRRTNSVRSKLANRRSRGSSAATGQSAIGAMIGASTAALANPASGPRLSGFSVAPKQRNRTFHQLFRSVPEDDYLIEDYSCALQRDILLAGRIYISEGHICFSSNILGWVTTLVISFDEVVSVERENTAIVIPNAIAIQTLHARHTFRSLLSREATFDLLIGIWKVSHPTSFHKSMNGKQLAAEETKDAVNEDPTNVASGQESGSSDDDSDEEDEEGSDGSLLESAGSIAGSDLPLDTKSVSRKPSAMNGVAAAVAQVATVAGGAVSDIPPAIAAAVGVPDSTQDFPGPATHAPTDCTDAATHYDKIVKDEIISAPLGKVYSLLYGPQSGVFVRKYLVDECKCLELVLEDDKKGLSNDIKSRQYSYIKPLGGSIGPKQTKCITTETLDFFELERAVTVTCSTLTPDVPSGNAFATKTRYCLTWAPGNATRFQMNCTIEWSAKSWLKGPIEKGANDGQQQYGDGIVKMLKAAVGRPRGLTVASKVSKGGKVKKRRSKKGRDEKVEEKKAEPHWGLFEPLRGPLGPLVDIARPVLNLQALVGLLFIMVTILWFSGGRGATSIGFPGRSERTIAYEELWRREEGQLWDWLEERAGLDVVTLNQMKEKRSGAAKGDEKRKAKARQKVLKSKDVEARLREERMSEREMEDALRVTRERLEILEGVVGRRKEGVI